MAFFKHKSNNYGGYQMLKDILLQEQELGIYQGRANILIRHEKYAQINEVDIAIDSDDTDELTY